MNEKAREAWMKSCVNEKAREAWMNIYYLVVKVYDK